MSWRAPRFNLAELAVLRWIEGRSRKELAEHFGKTEGAVQNFFQEIRRRNFAVPGLAPVIAAKIRTLDKGEPFVRRKIRKERAS